MYPATFVLILLALALPALPRRYLPAAFLAGAILIPPTAFLTVGPLHFYPFRIMVMAGLVRMLIRSERPLLFPQRLDKIVLAFGVICIASSAFHTPAGQAFIYRTAMALDWVGTYFLFRTWIRCWEDVELYVRSVVVIMIPFAGAMMIERLTGHDVFASFAGMRAESVLRNGLPRASGPFVNYINAGTAGAVCLPLVVSLIRDNKRFAWVGIACCLAIAYASTSSGPLVTCLSGFLALWLWRYRVHLRKIIWGCIGALLVMQLFMHRPVWFLMSDVDITHGNNGWYRAMLISRAIEHLNEWWLAGCDYTRNWMATGAGAAPNMADLCDNYIWLGVLGGLPLLLCFTWILRECFRQISKACRALPESALKDRYKLWCLGSSLFAHCTTFVCMAYYDETAAFFYSLAGAIGSAYAVLLSVPVAVAAVETCETGPEPVTVSDESTPVPAAITRWTQDQTP